MTRSSKGLTSVSGYGRETLRWNWRKIVRPSGFPIDGHPMPEPISNDAVHRPSIVSTLDRLPNRETELRLNWSENALAGRGGLGRAQALIGAPAVCVPVTQMHHLPADLDRFRPVVIVDVVPAQQRTFFDPVAPSWCRGSCRSAAPSAWLHRPPGINRPHTQNPPSPIQYLARLEVLLGDRHHVGVETCRYSGRFAAQRDAGNADPGLQADIVDRPG